jgi:hypothetical protein
MGNYMVWKHDCLMGCSFLEFIAHRHEKSLQKVCKIMESAHFQYSNLP